MKQQSLTIKNPASREDAERGRRPSGASSLEAPAATTLLKRQSGRPLKYRHLLEILEDDTIYSPGSIVRNGEEKGLLSIPEGSEERNLQRLRIRHTLSRFARNHEFPRPGEGWVTLIGLAPTPGWRGSTWKAALPQ